MQRLQASSPAAAAQQLSSTTAPPCAKPCAGACSKTACSMDQPQQAAKDRLHHQPFLSSNNDANPEGGAPAGPDGCCHTAGRQQISEFHTQVDTDTASSQPSAALRSREGCIGRQTSVEQTEHQPGVTSDGLCAICLESPTEIVFQPCLHAAACVACARKIMAKAQECPICRSPLQSAVLLVGPVMQCSMYCT